MRKIALLIVCLIAGMATSFAQRGGDKALGLNLNYASETSLGIGTRFQYNITDNVRIEPEFAYYFKHDNTSFWDLGLNFSYLFPVAQDVTLYPLVGLGCAHSKLHCGNNVSVNDFQGKFGAGAEFQLMPDLKLIIEPKFQLLDGNNQFVITAGMAYCF